MSLPTRSFQKAPPIFNVRFSGQITFAEQGEVRNAVIVYYQGVCQYCGRPVGGNESNVDHIYPWEQGGQNILENYTLAHRHCNSVKHASILAEAELRDRIVRATAAVPKIALMMEGILRPVVTIMIAAEPDDEQRELLVEWTRLKREEERVRATLEFTEDRRKGGPSVPHLTRLLMKKYKPHLVARENPGVHDLTHRH